MSASHPATAGSSPSGSGRVNWRLLGACNDADRALFFGPDVEHPADKAAREAEAVAVCGRCPVRAKCASHAIASGVKWGCWGGMGEAELAAERTKYLRRQRGYDREAAA